MEGAEGKEFLVRNKKNEKELTRVEEAAKEVFGRTGGAGFPFLFHDIISRLSAVKRVERAGVTALVYHGAPPIESCSDVEVEGLIGPDLALVE